VSGTRTQRHGHGHRGRKRSNQRVHRPESEHQSGRGTADRQHQALGHQLTHDPSAARADRQPYGDLLLSRCAPREHHVCEVQRRDQQHDPRQRHEQTGRHGEGPVALRTCARGHTGQPAHRQQLVAILSRIGMLELSRDRFQPRVRRLQLQFGPKRSGENQRRMCAIVEARAFVLEDVVHDDVEHAKRQIELGSHDGHGSRKPLGRDADDGEIVGVDPDGAADEVQPAALRLPAGVCRDDDRNPGAWPLLIGRERTTRRQMDPQRLEVVRGHDTRKSPPHGVAGRHAHHREPVGHQILEDVSTVPDVHVIRIRKRAIRVRSGAIVAEQPDHLSRAA